MRQVCRRSGTVGTHTPGLSRKRTIKHERPLFRGTWRPSQLGESKSFVSRRYRSLGKMVPPDGAESLGFRVIVLHESLTRGRGRLLVHFSQKSPDTDVRWPRTPVSVEWGVYIIDFFSLSPPLFSLLFLLFVNKDWSPGNGRSVPLRTRHRFGGRLGKFPPGWFYTCTSLRTHPWRTIVEEEISVKAPRKLCVITKAKVTENVCVSSRVVLPVAYLEYVKEISFTQEDSWLFVLRKEKGKNMYVDL